MREGVVVLNKVLNKESKYYGLKLVGLVFGSVFGMLLLITTHLTIGIIGSVIGYSVGAWLSGLVHSGLLQRWLYWNLLGKFIFGGKYLPPSYLRIFM